MISQKNLPARLPEWSMKKFPHLPVLKEPLKTVRAKCISIFYKTVHRRPVSAPYSLRPKPGATVSMPLHWDEVKKGLKMQDFNIYNALDRIKTEGDIFKPVLKKGINLLAAVNKLSKER